MNAIYIYLSVSGLTVLEKLYGTARPEILPAPSALFAIHQASLMMKNNATSSPTTNESCLSIRKGKNLVLIAELVGSGFIVAIILDRLISNSFATALLRVIVEDVGKLAVVSFSKRMIAESLTKSYYFALLRAASQVQSTFGFVSHHTLNMVFMYPSAGPAKTASPATLAANSPPLQAKSNKLNTVPFISDSDTKMGWMQYFSIVMRRLSPFRSSAQLHKVTPEVVQPSTSSAQPPPVYVCPYLEIITSSVDQIVDNSFDKQLELASTAPVIIKSIVQHLQVQPRRAAWEVPLTTELYLYDPEDRSLSRPTSLIESGSKDDSEEIRPALSTGPTTALRTEGEKNRTSAGRKDNSVFAQQQRQAAQLRIVHFSEQQLVAVFQRKAGAGAGAGIEHDPWESQGNYSQNSVELIDFQLWAKQCLVRKMVPGVKELPVDIL